MKTTTVASSTSPADSTQIPAFLLPKPSDPSAESFGIVPHGSNRSTPVVADNQNVTKKPHPESLEQKLSTEQRSKLCQWLAEHSYTEVQDLIAALPPDGFGLSVAKSTLSRFYKAHFTDINLARQLLLDRRALELRVINEGGDYVEALHHSSRQLLLERYFELLSQPVESADDLKKLASVAEIIKDVHLDEQLARRRERLFPQLLKTPAASGQESPH